LDPQNIGENLLINETALLITNKILSKKIKLGIIVAIIKGTIIENIIEILQNIPLKQ
jgi:hypothetical protein